MGMMAACRLGQRVREFPANSADRVESLLRAFGLPVWLPRFPVEDYLRVMQSDKKVQSGRMRFVVPVAIGEVIVRNDIEESDLIAVLEASFAPA